MKKFLTFVLVAMAAMAVNAKQVTFTFNDATAITSYGITVPDAGKGTDLSGTEFTVDGITFSCVKVNKNDTRIWNSSGNYSLRTYGDNTITFTSEGDNIKGLQVFSTQGSFAELSNGMMTCDAKEVTITCTATAYINSIIVYVNETPVVTVDTLDVKAAIDLIAAAPNQKLTKNMCVRGRVTSINNSGAAQYGNIDVYMVDITNPADTMEAYRMKSYDGASYKDVAIQFGVGDTIVFNSSEWSYYAEGSVYEGFGCSLVKVYGVGHPIEIETITVAQALEIGNALEDNAKTTETYVVEGFVVKAYDYDEQYKNQSFYMSDDVTAERGDFFAKYTTGDVVAEGDKVQVKGQIEKNVKDDKTTIQIYKGKATIVSHVGLNNVKAASKAVKTIENGQFVIEANGVRYNVLGTAL